jgi:hypothetical protein
MCKIYLWTASKFDFHTHTQVCVVTKKSLERTLPCQNVNTPIHADCHHHCRRHPKHTFRAPMVLFCFHSIRGSRDCVQSDSGTAKSSAPLSAVYTSFGLLNYRKSRTLTGYILNTCTMICFSCCHKK